MVEIAYGVSPNEEGRGFATEAARALLDYALAIDQVRVVRAHTLPGALASQRVLAKCGFKYLGEVTDPEDGVISAVRSFEEIAMFRTALCSVPAFLLIGCGSPGNAPAGAPIAAKPDVVITFDGANHACVVALASEQNGNTIPCAELIPFLRDELRVANGAIYDTRVTGNADGAEVARTTQNLNDAGYRFIGGH